MITTATQRGKPQPHVLHRDFSSPTLKSWRRQQLLQCEMEAGKRKSATRSPALNNRLPLPRIGDLMIGDDDGSLKNLREKLPLSVLLLSLRRLLIGIDSRFTMEYGKSNKFPKHDSDFKGAIFMCNNLTKKECFRRKLFGLPSVYLDFVNQIKTGMMLFLFESDERKLNGIFQATSDGAMNIVPTAFSVSKKCFPAQVRFERLCACRPLFENEFSEAIEENYFTTIKFSFALSGQQVCSLIWLFSSRSYLPYDQLPGGLQSEFMKIFENSSLARTKVTGTENLPKFDAAGYNMDNNIQPTRNTFLPGRSKNHLTSYKNHDHDDITLQNHTVRGQHKPYPAVTHSHGHDDITLQNHMVRWQHKPYPAVSHSTKLQRHSQMLSKSCNDLSRVAIPVVPSDHPSYSSSRCLYKQPSVALGTDLLEQKLTFCSGSSLDAQTPHIRKQSYASASNIGLEDFPLSNYPGIDISKSSRFSKPSQLFFHPPERHVNFHDFSQKAFHDSYDLSKDKFLHSSPQRLQAMASTSFCSRNARFHSRHIQQEDDSSGPDHIPISEGETLVNSDYIPVLEGYLAYAKESFELPSRKQNPPLASRYDYNFGFTSYTNNSSNGSSDFSYNDKNSASDFNTFPQSNTFQKRCNVFCRLSRPPKKIKYPSVDDTVEAFYHHRSHRTKARGKLENFESFETDVPLDNIGELEPFENGSLVEIKPQIEEFDDMNGFSIPSFKRRSVVKRQSIEASDFTGCVDKCKRRKIIRPSFSKEDNSSQDLNLPYAASSDSVHKRHDDHNISCTVPNPAIKASLDFRIDDNISKIPAEQLPFSKDSAALGEDTGSATLSSTDSLTVDIHGNQQTLDCDSETRKSVAKESEKISSCNLMRDENVNGKPHEDSCALLLDFIPLQVEYEHEAINFSSVSTSMKHIIEKMEAKDLVCGDKNITSD